MRLPTIAFGMNTIMAFGRQKHRQPFYPFRILREGERRSRNLDATVRLLDRLNDGDR